MAVNKSMERNSVTADLMATRPWVPPCRVITLCSWVQSEIPRPDRYPLALQVHDLGSSILPRINQQYFAKQPVPLSQVAGWPWSDIALKHDLPRLPAQRMAAYVGSIAGAVLTEDYRAGLLNAGFQQGGTWEASGLGWGKAGEPRQERGG